MPIVAGLDWGGNAHAVCVLDDDGAIFARFGARHAPACLADLWASRRRSARRPTRAAIGPGALNDWAAHCADFRCGCRT